MDLDEESSLLVPEFFAAPFGANENICHCKQHLHPSFSVLISALGYRKFDLVALFQPSLFLVSFQDATFSPAVSKMQLDYQDVFQNVMLIRLGILLCYRC